MNTRFAALLLSVCLTASSAAALAAQERPGVQVTDEGVLLDFQGTDLSVVISMLAEMAGLTVSYTGLPSRPVTLRSPSAVPRRELRAMLESVVRSNGLAMTEEAGMIRITAVETPAAPPPPAFATGPAGPGGMRLYTYRLKHTEAESLAQTLRELFGLADRSYGSRETPSDLGSGSRELRRQRLPLPVTSEAAAPAAVTGERTPTSGGLSAQVRGPVQIVPYSLNNSVMIRASAEDYETIRAAIAELDTRPLQVVIEALIAEVRRDRQMDLGIDVSVPDQKDWDSGITLGGEMKGSSAGDVVLRVLDIGAVKADVVVRALAASSRVSILSRPVVLAQNNQEARILVGSQRPFVQLFRALPTDAAVRDQVVQYRDVGTQLTIKPTINPDGYVTLDVLQEVSSATAETQFGAPVISTREAQTRLFVRDGHTAVIGGLVDTQREGGNSGIPILKDLPLIGMLFRSSRQRSTTTELFILLTPHVVRVDEDMDAVSREIGGSTDALRRILRKPDPLIDRTGPVKRP